MGGDKLRRLWRGRPLLAWVVEAALAAPVERVWLVLGCDADLAALIPADPRLEVVTAEDWASGLSASLRAGIAALPSGAGAALVLLADMPRIPAETAAALIGAWREGAPAAAPVWNGARGHPVLLGANLFPAVAALQGDRGAGSLLAALGDRVARVAAADDGVVFDVDTPDLLEA